MYITLKGTGKIPFVSVLRILLICKFLNIMAVFTEKFSKFPNNFPCKKVNLILMHPTHCSFEEHCYVFQFCQLSVKVTFKQTMKNNGYWIFLIFLVFNLANFLEIETREGWIVQRVHMYIWAAAGHELTAIGTRVQSFNLWLIS